MVGIAGKQLEKWPCTHRCTVGLYVLLCLAAIVTGLALMHSTYHALEEDHLHGWYI